MANLDFIQDPFLLTSLCRLASLFWIHSIFLEHSKTPINLIREFRNLQARLLKHRLDCVGSTIMLWEILLKNKDGVGVDGRTWRVVRFMNVVKSWDMDLLDSLARLLYGYLSNSLDFIAEKQLLQSVSDRIMDIGSFKAEEDPDLFRVKEEVSYSA
jgi:hypothetical protein